MWVNIYCNYFFQVSLSSSCIDNIKPRCLNIVTCLYFEPSKQNSVSLNFSMILLLCPNYGIIAIVAAASLEGISFN